MGRPTGPVCCGRHPEITTSFEDPAVLGDPTGEPPIRVRAVQAAGGFRRSQEGWATGTRLAGFLSAGLLEAL